MRNRQKPLPQIDGRQRSEVPRSLGTEAPPRDPHRLNTSPLNGSLSLLEGCLLISYAPCPKSTIGHLPFQVQWVKGFTFKYMKYIFSKDKAETGWLSRSLA